MTKKTIIVLCSMIVLLLAIIVAGVSYLYSGVDANEGYVAAPVMENAQAEDEDAAPIPADETDAAGKAVREPVPAKETTAKEPIAKEIKVSVKNCKTGKQNTFRQNKDNSVELIDESGKSLWKKELPGKICSEVVEIDYFNNGKIQFMFCQGKNLHALDRLGREVSGFPKTLPYSVIGGPFKAEVKGRTYWRMDTAQGPLYVSINNQQTKILTDIPK